MIDKTEPRVVGYDLIKTLAIFLVVFYHVGGLDYGEVVPGEYYIPNLNKVLSSFCAASVPLFFMVNGALILPRHLSLKLLLYKSLKFIVLYIFGKIVLQYLLCQKLFGISHEMVHFWFLLTLAGIYPVSYFLDKYPYLKRIVLTILLVCPFLTNLFGDIFVFFFPQNDLPRLAHTGLFTLYSLVYFYLGFWLRNIQLPTKVSIALLFFGLILVNFEVIAMSTHYSHIYDSGSAALPTIGAACMAVSLFSSLKRVNLGDNLLGGVISYFGRQTMHIYMLHVLFLFWIRHFFLGYSNNMSILSAVFFSALLMCLCSTLRVGQKQIS